MDLGFNGARPEGQDAGHGVVDVESGPRLASMVPGPKARMQASCVSSASSCPRRFNGARPEGQDAGRPEGRLPDADPAASMVPGPKARMQVMQRGEPERSGARASMVPGPKARMQERAPPWGPSPRPRFNGARPEGQDAGLAWTDDYAEAVAASMVPGPKARMQAASTAMMSPKWKLQWCPARRPGCRSGSAPRACSSGRRFNGARPEGQDAGEL